MKSENQALKGLYDGALKKSTHSDDFKLHHADSSLARKVWNNIHNTGLVAMINGFLHAEEFLTGVERFKLRQFDRIGVLLDEDYSGGKVGVSRYDLVFYDGEEDRVYRNSSLDELEDEMYV